MAPPMGDPMMGGGPNGGMQPMDDQMMDGDSDGMDIGNDDDSAFDTNFDAGVDADENTDPKKFIQQLTGKLSQSLRKYNNDLPKPDEELSKYVAGMILKQTTDGLTDSDKKDIIDKVNGNGSNNDSGDDMPPMEDQSMEMQNDIGKENPMMEGFNRRKLINELFQELTTVNNKTNSKIADRPLKNVGFKKKPFTAPSMR